MVLDPRQIEAALSRVLSEQKPDPAALEARARYSRFVWDAIRAALKDSCPCRACAALNQAFDTMAGPSPAAPPSDAQSYP